jgi:hypothetical protein
MLVVGRSLARVVEPHAARVIAREVNLDASIAECLEAPTVIRLCAQDG